MKTLSLRVADYMTRKVISVSADTELMRAVYLLIDKGLSGVPVVSENKTLVGMFTERDCLAVAINAGYFDEPGGLVADFMSQPVETVTSQDTIMDVATRFRDTRFHRFPVVDDGRLVGIVSRRDVLRALKRGVWFQKR